jgi:hypothetical protein
LKDSNKGLEEVIKACHSILNIRIIPIVIKSKIESIIYGIPTKCSFWALIPSPFELRASPLIIWIYRPISFINRFFSESAFIIHQTVKELCSKNSEEKKYEAKENNHI